MDGSEYQESGRWLEEYQYEDEEGELAFPNTPKITSHFRPGESLPKLYLATNVSGGHDFSRAEKTPQTTALAPEDLEIPHCVSAK